MRFCYVVPASSRHAATLSLPARPRDRQLEIAAAEESARPLTAARSGSEIRDRVRTRVVPEYTSSHYGDPAICNSRSMARRRSRPGRRTAPRWAPICHLKQPQRERNLRMRLEEYLPFGLDYGLIYVT